jgi:hypothetical protein
MTGSKKLVVSSALGVCSEVRLFFATWRRIGVGLSKIFNLVYFLKIWLEPVFV